jgi:hypothetical protein
MLQPRRLPTSDQDVLYSNFYATGFLVFVEPLGQTDVIYICGLSLLQTAKEVYGAGYLGGKAGR